MIRAYETPVGETVELGRVSTDAETVERYWRTHGLSPAEGRRPLPLGLALALRGGPLPAVELDPRAVSFHAGHTLSARRPFVAGRTYGVRARIAEVFEKSGRSGPLTVVARTAELYDADAVVVAIHEQQIVRWRAPDAAEPPHPRAVSPRRRTAAGDHGGSGHRVHHRGPAPPGAWRADGARLRGIARRK